MQNEIAEINRSAWNKIVKEGRKIHASKSKKENEFINLFINLTPAGGKILDLGCGTGIPGLKVTGIDISDEMIKLASNNLPKAKFTRMPMTDIDFDEKFDGVISSYSLLCLPPKDFNLMSDKIHRALKRGGYFLLFLNEGDSKEGQIQEVQGQQMYSTGKSEEEIRDTFETKGMKIEKIDRETGKTAEYGLEHEMMFLMRKI
jgi:SAM-dependent methyltransferase